MKSHAAYPVTKATGWSSAVICTVAFLGFFTVVLMNIPPFVRSNHVSVNSNMLFIAGFGSVLSMMALGTVLFLPASRRIGKLPSAIIGVEATVTLTLCIALLYRSLRFFGIV